MRIISYIVILVLVSCFEQEQNSNKKPVVENPLSDEQTVDGVNMLNNDLISTIKGFWVSAILPDSILESREVYKWGSIFYGSSLISIKSNDSLSIAGAMDGGDLRYQIEGNSKIFVPEWNIKLEYIKNKDIIVWLNDSQNRVYRRITNDDFKKITTSEKLLARYIQSLLFTENNLPVELRSKIRDVYLGLETDYYFSFDVIGIEEDEKINYYGWEFSADTLILYNTNINVENAEYTRGKVYKKYHMKR